MSPPLRFAIRVTPGARRPGVGGCWGDDRALIVRVAARPTGGKANAAVVAALAEAFGVPRRQVSIVRGATGRSKTVVVDDAVDGASRLARLLDDPT